MYIAKSQEQLLIDALNNILSVGSVGNLSPGSKARAIVEAAASVIGGASVDISNGILQTLLPNARGVTLDYIAESYGVQRLPAVPARVEAGDQNFKYYVRTGTFGDINGGNNIVIPAGTQIFSASQNINAYFIQRNSITLNAGDSEHYFAADQAGPISINPNISQNTMVRHTFTGYNQSAFNSLLVTNTGGIAGRPAETDEGLRFRIRRKLATNAGATEAAIRTTALQVPGVSDVRVISNRAGLGSYDVVVLGVNPQVAQSVLLAVQRRLQPIAAAGAQVLVVPPRLVGVSLNTTVKFQPNTSIGQKNAAINNAQDVAREYILGLSPGDTFDINYLVSLVIQSSQSILSIGRPGKPFESLYIWKASSPNSQNRFSRKLETNYLLQDDEEMVAEISLANPLVFTY